DVSMPVMDGFETAGMIRARKRSEHTPIIFVTSVNGSENQISRGYSLGAVDYILSPIVPSVLKSKVSVFVELYKKTEQIRRQAEQLREIEEAEHRRRLNEAVDRLEIQTQRNRFFTLANDMLAVANFDGYMLQLNPAWEQTLGFTNEELKSRPGPEFAHPDDRAAMQFELRELQTANATRYCETRIQHKDGSYRWLGWTATPFSAERLIYIFARDITERRKSEEQIRALNEELSRRISDLIEVNSELESFNYSISHDLRAPLRSMQGFARALLEDENSKLSPEGHSYAQRIVNSGGYMDTLLHDLLNYSRLSCSEMKLEAVDVDQAVKEVVLRHEPEIKERHARVEVKPNLGFVLAHGTTLGQVFTNLFGNALKFVKPSQPPVVRIWAEQQGATARIYIEDEGIGIDSAHHKKVFGLFERLHTNNAYPGTGVGLAIVRKGVERMGGRVGLESRVGHGCRFWIELPVASPVENPSQMTDAARNGNAHDLQ